MDQHRAPTVQAVGVEDPQIRFPVHRYWEFYEAGSAQACPVATVEGRAQAYADRAFGPE